MSREMIKATCEECKGTGLRHLGGHGRRGLKCTECDGRGFITLVITPFAGLERRTDIDHVMDVKDEPITYEEFLQWWSDNHGK